MDNNWVDDTHPDGKTIFFDVDGNTFNAWQTVEFYCDQITALGYRLESDYAANFAVYNEGSVENIFTIPMNKTLYTNQMQYLFRSRHYNHAKALGLSGENGSSATIEALQTFGYETNEQDPRFDYCYYAGTVYDGTAIKGKLDRSGRGRNLYLFLYYRRTDREDRDRFKSDPYWRILWLDDLCRSFRF